MGDDVRRASGACHDENAGRLDHDDFELKQSKIMNVIDP
jgi:hypothetical protein